MRQELENALSAARELPPEELPRLLGELEEIRTTALARLASPAPAAQEDVLLGIDEAADRMGVGKDWLYHNHDRLPFTRRVGKRLLFSKVGLERYLRTAKAS